MQYSGVGMPCGARGGGGGPGGGGGGGGGGGVGVGVRRRPCGRARREAGGAGGRRRPCGRARREADGAGGRRRPPPAPVPSPGSSAASPGLGLLRAPSPPSPPNPPPFASAPHPAGDHLAVVVGGEGAVEARVAAGLVAKGIRARAAQGAGRPRRADGGVVEARGTRVAVRQERSAVADRRRRAGRAREAARVAEELLVGAVRAGLDAVRAVERPARGDHALVAADGAGDRHRRLGAAPGGVVARAAGRAGRLGVARRVGAEGALVHVAVAPAEARLGDAGEHAVGADADRDCVLVALDAVDLDEAVRKVGAAIGALRARRADQRHAVLGARRVVAGGDDAVVGRDRAGLLGRDRAAAAGRAGLPVVAVLVGAQRAQARVARGRVVAVPRARVALAVRGRADDAGIGRHAGRAGDAGDAGAGVVGLVGAAVGVDGAGLGGGVAQDRARAGRIAGEHVCVRKGAGSGLGLGVV
jgi:hypothetical protein